MKIGEINFDDLVKRIRPKLRGIAVKLDGKYTSFNDDDLYQEALFELWKKHTNNQLQDKTESYILQGCLFFLKNYIRKTYTRLDHHSISLEKNINEEHDTVEDVLPVESIGVFQSSAIAVLQHDAERLLTAREKEVLLLYLEDFTTREIGKRLGISHVMVVKLLGKIRSKCGELKKEFLK
ncbi:MAG: sigma-70 family RNA polymerase sigma factor [Candidatus Omnitrophica bacterium]|nr:sigma-70 family RNA polymerase sigma factor [Candidatus Omnitrophota bacterium]